MKTKKRLTPMAQVSVKPSNELSRLALSKSSWHTCRGKKTHSEENIKQK